MGGGIYLSTFYRGATLDMAMTITDKTTGAPKALTGATVRFRLAQTVGVSAVYDQSMTIEATPGNVTHSIPATTTLNFNGNYIFTVHVTDALGKVDIAVQGPIAFADIVLGAAT